MKVVVVVLLVLFSSCTLFQSDIRMIEKEIELRSGEYIGYYNDLYVSLYENNDYQLLVKLTALPECISFTSDSNMLEFFKLIDEILKNTHEEKIISHPSLKLGDSLFPIHPITFFEKGSYYIRQIANDEYVKKVQLQWKETVKESVGLVHSFKVTLRLAHSFNVIIQDKILFYEWF